MTEDGVAAVVRQAIGGDAVAIGWIMANAATTDETAVVAMAALLEGQAVRLDVARSAAVTSRDRQLLAITRAHLDGDGDLVDALARDHLADFPDSLIVAWIASDAAARRRHEDRRVTEP